MSGEVNGSRSYRSDVRAEQARSTRASILEAAPAVVVSQGYGATTVRQVAADAGVALDMDWATNTADCHPLLVLDRGRTNERFRLHLRELGRRLLLR